MTPNQEIKPCPFCGGNNEVYSDDKKNSVACERHWDNGYFLSISYEDWQGAECWKLLSERERLIEKLVKFLEPNETYESRVLKDEAKAMLSKDQGEKRP